MNIEITDEVFLRLQALGRPFIDTPSSVIARLLDAYEAEMNEDDDFKSSNSSAAPEVFGLDSLPPLTYTKVMGGHFNNEKPFRLNWDSILKLALIETLNKSGSVDEVKKISGAQIREGIFEDQGYKYVSSHGFSYQGVSAATGMQIIARCARALGYSLEVEFVWRENPDAFRPGSRGIIRHP